MSSPRERYLEEVDSRLSKHVPQDRRQEILSELRSHLHLSFKDLMLDGSRSAEEAEAEAVRSLGDPRDVADDLRRREAGHDTESVWKLAKLPVAALLVGWAFLFVMFGVNEFGTWTPRLNEVYEWVQMLVLPALVFAVWRTRRWLIKPIAWTIAATFVLGIAIFIPIGRLQEPRAQQWAAQQTATIDRELAAYRAAAAGDLSAVREGDAYKIPSPPMEAPVMSVVRLPYLPVEFTLPESSRPWVTLGVSSSERHARQEWELHGQKVIAAKEEERAAILQTSPGLSVRTLALMAGTSLYRIAFLAALNWLVLAVAGWTRTLRRRRHRLYAPAR
jgi:hypothetical protein